MQRNEQLVFSDEVKNEKNNLDILIDDLFSFLQEIPAPFICPISKKIMENPVVDTKTGNSFDKSSLSKDAITIPNVRLKQLIETYQNQLKMVTDLKEALNNQADVLKDAKEKLKVNQQKEQLEEKVKFSHAPISSQLARIVDKEFQMHELKVSSAINKIQRAYVRKKLRPMTKQLHFLREEKEVEHKLSVVNSKLQTEQTTFAKKLETIQISHKTIQEKFMKEFREQSKAKVVERDWDGLTKLNESLLIAKKNIVDAQTREITEIQEEQDSTINPLQEELNALQLIQASLHFQKATTQYSIEKESKKILKLTHNIHDGEKTRALLAKEQLIFTEDFAKGLNEEKNASVTKLNTTVDREERVNALVSAFETEHSMDLECSVSLEAMTDPYLTEVGQSYQKANIENHLKNALTDPLTQVSISNIITPNNNLKAVIPLLQQAEITRKEKLNNLKAAIDHRRRVLEMELAEISQQLIMSQNKTTMVRLKELAQQGNIPQLIKLVELEFLQNQLREDVAQETKIQDELTQVIITLENELKILVTNKKTQEATLMDSEQHFAKIITEAAMAHEWKETQKLAMEIDTLKLSINQTIQEIDKNVQEKTHQLEQHQQKKQTIINKLQELEKKLLELHSEKIKQLDNLSHHIDQTDRYLFSVLPIQEFLKFVSENNVKKVREMLQKSPDLAKKRGAIYEEGTKRIFANITGLQYAIWALDWQMWQAIADFMEDSVVKKQLTEFMKKGTLYGYQFDYNNLIRAFNQYDASKLITWRPIADEQRLLPVHVVKEYCQEDRPFDFIPDFNVPASGKLLARREVYREDKKFENVPMDEKNILQAWYEPPAEDPNASALGWLRCHSDANILRLEHKFCPYQKLVTENAAAMISFFMTRIEQRNSFMTRFGIAPPADATLTQQFLQVVAEGDLNKVSQMLDQHPQLAEARGTIIDYSGRRTFKNVTAFQYAIWALDWPMWRKIQSKLSPAQISAQMTEWEQHWQTKCPTLKQMYFDLQPLLKALHHHAIDNKKEILIAVLAEKRLLPVHFVREFLNPTFPEARFENMSRPDLVDATKIFQNWYNGQGNANANLDMQGIKKLASVRNAQLQELKATFLSAHEEKVLPSAPPASPEMFNSLPEVDLGDGVKIVLPTAPSGVAALPDPKYTPRMFGAAEPVKPPVVENAPSHNQPRNSLENNPR